MKISSKFFSSLHTGWYKCACAALFLLVGAFSQASSLQEITSLEDSNDITSSDVMQVFGDWLFEGGFSNSSFSGVNPDYKISQGDLLLVQLWGGVDFQKQLKVDAQGNIFIPKVGPIRVAGVSNADLNRVLLNAVKRVYKSNVDAYVTLQSVQKVKVFLAGLVNKPGLYEGQSGDSLLKFIDQAGGVREDLGGYRQIKIKRNKKTIASIDLYQFIGAGALPLIQLQEGDVIFVGARKGQVSIEGEVGFSGLYELSANDGELSEVLSAVAPTSRATHVTLIEISGLEVNAKQFSIAEASKQLVSAGTRIKVSSQQRAANISVEVVGEHDSARELILPARSSLKDVLDLVRFTKSSNQEGIQLYRESVAAQQREALLASLASLERNVLATPSSTNEAAQLRKSEAEGVLNWIGRAREADPKGQIILPDGYNPALVFLRQGDRVVIPSQKSLVIVHGDVIFPTAIAYDRKRGLKFYLAQAGGVVGKLKDKIVLIKRPNGSFVSLNGRAGSRIRVKAGDEIFVLSKPDVKSLQLIKDISQVVYQVVVAAAVLVAF